MSTIKKSQPLNFINLFKMKPVLSKASVKKGLLAFTIAAAILNFGCTKNDSNSKSAQQGQDDKVVNLSIWGNYISPEMIQKFEEKTGIKVKISNYTSNEELLAKIQAGAAGVDVAVPSDYMVTIMAKLGLLQSLDKSKIPNIEKVAPDVLNKSFDPGNTYSLPYAWSTAGIAVNRDLYQGPINSWKDIFNDPKLSGKVSLLDDVREVTAAALKVNGYSVNTTKPEELKKAEEILLKAKPRIKMFRSDTVDLLVNKQVAVAQAYSTDALQAAAKSGSKIEYILPEEGGTQAIDTLVILKNAPHPEAAHKLINFMLSEEVNVEFVKTMWGGPVLSTTKEKLPDAVKTSQALFPAPEKLAKFENIQDLGEETKLYDDLWTKIKTE